MEVFRSQKLASLSGIRFGTASTGFLPLTFRGNSRRRVLAQRRAFAHALGVPLNQLILGRQMHGRRIRIVTEQESGAGVLTPRTYMTATDGLLTQRPNVALGVFTADCIPVFLADPQTGWIGILHVGWKGAVKNIAGHALAILKKQGVEPRNVEVWLGPSICGKCYTVHNTKRLQVIRTALRGSVRSTAAGGMVDLRAAVVGQLLAAGVRRTKIDAQAPCTHESVSLPSFRRDGVTKTNTLSIISRVSPPMDLRGKRVVIFGLGLQGGGEASVRYAALHHAQVTVVDARPRKDFTKVLQHLRGLPVQYFFGQKNPTTILQAADIILKNPGVRPDHPGLQAARRSCVLVVGDLGLFRSQSTNPVYAVTGTKGKTTVASMLARLVQAKYPKAVLAGNVGVSPLAFANAFDGKTPVILETSSFQLEDTMDVPLAPHVAIVTSLFPDHLDRYSTMQAYVRAKQLIVRDQTKQDFLIVPFGHPAARRFTQKTKANVLWFAEQRHPHTNAWVEHGWIWVKFGARTQRILQLQHLRSHHPAFVRNAMIVALAARALGFSPPLIAKQLYSFAGVPNRYQEIRKHAGVTWINDTTATNPEAAALSMRAPHSGKLIVLAGGSDKRLPVQPLISALNHHAAFAVLFKGSVSTIVAKQLQIPYRIVPTMQAAVRLARTIAQSGDTVLLSPGAASFGIFRNEFDRGAQFVAAVRALV